MTVVIECRESLLWESSQKYTQHVEENSKFIAAEEAATAEETNRGKVSQRSPHAGTSIEKG